MLTAAVKAWPKRIERMSIQVYTDDFSSDKRNRDKFQLNKKGRVMLVPGWLPSEKDMDAFISEVKKDRSNLHKVHLSIRARTTVFTSEGLLSKEIFSFMYIKKKPFAALQEIKNKAGPALTEKTPNALGSKDQPIDVDDFDLCTTPAPETNTAIDHSVVQALYEAMIEHQELLDFRDGDSLDDTDAEIGAMQERADELSAGSEEDEEDWRPR